MWTINLVSKSCRFCPRCCLDLPKTFPQRLQWTQIIWVCPDIWVFSVLDNRHLADICAFCQKCQFEVRKAWNALFLQLKPHEMHCKQADSAILKIRCGWNYANCEYVLFAYGLLSYSDFKQTRAFVAKRDMSQIRAFSDFFWLRFDSDNCDLTQTLLRHLSQKMVTGASEIEQILPPPCSWSPPFCFRDTICLGINSIDWEYPGGWSWTSLWAT